MNVAAIKSKVLSLTFPTFKFPTITMPWDRSINEMKVKVCELEFELSTYAEHLQELQEELDDRFDNLETVNRSEVEAMLEESCDASVEEALSEFDVEQEVQRSLRNASFEVSLCL